MLNFLVKTVARFVSLGFLVMAFSVYQQRTYVAIYDLFVSAWWSELATSTKIGQKHES